MRAQTVSGNFAKNLVWKKQLVRLALLISISLYAGAVRAQVVFDSASSNGAFDNAGVTSLSWSHTVGSGSNRLLIVGVSTFTNAPLPVMRVTGVTYGGTPLTRIATQLAPDNQSAIEMFQLVNPPSGTANVAVNLLAVNYVVGGSASFSNVNQTTPTRTPQTNSGTGTSPTVTVTSAPSEIVIDTVGTQTGVFLAPSANQTVGWNGRPFFSNSFDVGAGSTQPGASPSVTMSWIMNGSLPWAIGAVSLISQPTAADANLSGQIRSSDGAPIAGTTVTLNGTESRRTITDDEGNYHFDNLETNGFYTVTPSRANYTFSPVNRSFSLSGNRTDASFTGEPTTETANPLDTPEYFVRQQYLDFLGREPDEGGLDFWAGKLRQCGTEASCLHRESINISAAFFMSEEFQETGSFVYSLYRAGLGRRLSYAEFAADRQRVVDAGDMEARRQSYLASFVERAEFLQKYSEATTADSFVDALVQTIGQTSNIDLSGERATLIAKYNSSASMNEARALALREAIEDAGFRQAEYNRAFVLIEYFGYLRRDADTGGYQFWLDVLNNRVAGNYQSMVCAFLTSTEYQRRFSSVVTHSNGECR
ncbi:MAG: hypothetical protein AUG51_10460 [Acidobacteria bacterium 13_1_20CM_3_53_8]|nr:MAG: hypothetical protein AUG51_10460 [Acidobacteria bacterium 13_1_20CM_3_53_8]